MKRRLFSSICISLILASQTLMGGVALATAPPTPAPPATPTPPPTPTPPATPDPSPSATPTPPPTPTPPATPQPNPDGTGTVGGTSDNSQAGVATSGQTGAGQTGPTQTPGPNGPTGPSQPTGVIPDWVFDTVSQTWVAADKNSFMYDKNGSGYWLSPKYYYDTRVGWYEIVPAGSVQPSYMITAPRVIHTAFGDIVVGSADWQLAKMMGILDAQGQPTGAAALSVNGSGAGSVNQAGIANSTQSWFDLTNLVNVINTLQSAARSGNVAVAGNTSVGDSATGAAVVLANLINLLASAWSWSNGNLTFFMQNFFGNLTGDIRLQPNASTGGGGALGGGSAGISNTGNSSNNQANVDTNNTLNVNAQNTGNITNNVDLDAQSGNATAQGNTSAGNVTTGNAYAEANIINLINSFINSGSSFFGILNIFGSLNGDILFPDGFLNGLLTSSNSDPNGGTATNNTTGPNSTNQAGVTNNNQTTVNNTSDYGLANNIQTTANSGNATSGSNTQSGSTSTGNATTSNGLFNLVNSTIFGDNAVLVIVNVMGHWVGKIMNLAGGTTEAALLTGNAGTASNGATGPNSTNQASVSNSNQTTINQTNNGTITNNVNVHAGSGDATATDNSRVGNVSTGNAQAASNTANIVNSVLNIKHWFGVLVINVFGDWFGSVNENTDAGNLPASATAGGQGSGPAAAAPGVSSLAAGAAAALMPSSVAASGAHLGSMASIVAGTAAVTGGAGAVLAATHAAAPVVTAVAAAAKGNGMNLLFIISALMLLLAGATFSVERRLKRR